jgi:hypothetical protein
MQLEIDYRGQTLEIELNKIPNNMLEAVIRAL